MDIAAVAFHALTDDNPHNTDIRVLGPELLTYDDVCPLCGQHPCRLRTLTFVVQIAAKLSSCLGREVVHIKLSDDQRTQQLMSFGLPEHYAKFLTFLEVSSANGAEDRMNDAVERVCGRPPQTFDAFAQQNKAVWQ